MANKKGGGENSDGKDKKAAKSPKEKKATGKETAPAPKELKLSIAPLGKPPLPSKSPQASTKKDAARIASVSAKEDTDANKISATNYSAQNARRSTSVRFLSMPLEWNSEKIKDADLSKDGFTCCIVLVAEESSELSEYANFLYQTINTGVRKRFIALSGEEISAKVFQYMTSAQMREPGEDEDSHLGRMDLWAEAIKYCLLQCKASVDVETARKSAKENDNLGARSKDILQRLSPLQSPLKLGVKETEEEQSSADTAETKKSTPDQTKRTPTTKKDGKAPTVSPSETTNKDHDRQSGNFTTSLRKRGEIEMPFLQQIDDVPVNGSKCYVILQGFYNPRLIPEMKKIGVPINGILLLTNSDEDKKNFSIYDIEENIAGTFIPKNVLPDYVNIIQRRNSNAFRSNTNTVITQFWMELAALINNAPLQSCLHDIALLNCPLPKPEAGLNSPEGRAIFGTQIFDEAAQRIYEMHVLLDWFQEYKQAVYVRQITPIEAEIPHVLYESLVRQVPAECITVPIIMECMVEQAMVNVGIDKDSEEKKQKIAIFSDNMEINLGPDWGLSAFPKESESRTTFSSGSKKTLATPVFHKPKFIKSGDYAGIRTAHLNETFASHLASSQVTGDFHRLESILWQDLPPFHKGLYMKLLGNLNHFMYFLPPETIQLDDMFFILHLLMTAGVENHLQKLTEEKEKARQAEAKKPSLPVPLSLLINTHGPGSDVHYLPGTKLLSDHNYLTIDEEDALHFILAPTGGEDEMTVSQLGQTKNFRADTPEYVIEIDEEELEFELEKEFEGEVEEDAASIENQRNSEENESPRRASNDETRPEGKNSEDWAATGDIGRDSQESTASKKNKSQTQSEKMKSQIQTEKTKSETQTEKTKPQIQSEKRKFSNKALPTAPIAYPEEEGEAAGEDPTISKNLGVAQPPTDADVIDEDSKQFGKFGSGEETSKRFISCDVDFYKDLNDFSTFKTLLECPALLTMGLNGALDLTKWVETYLDCKGLTTAAGEGMMIGQLKDWNFVEELLPTQMIQVLSEAIGNYLSLQRMYCPFYDTILFIFNNPTPYSLDSDSNFVSKIHTLPGLQHFLEYTINDEEVLHWIMQLEQKKGVEVVDSFSAETLMKIVPEDQWVLAPSIKEKIIKRRLAKKRKLEELERLRMERNFPSRAKSMSKKKVDEIHPKRRKSKPTLLADDKRKQSEDAGTEEKKRKNSKKTKKSQIEGKKASKNAEEEKKEKNKEVKEIKTADDDKDAMKKGTKEEETTDAETIKDKPKSKSKKQSFNFTDAVKFSKGLKKLPSSSKQQLFHCYDLGKRMIITAIDTYHMFPLDGTVIQYEIATIEPEYRMMQLTITKQGHQSFFYPYYIPHDLDLSTESYVVIPYFHMVHNNGTIFSFQDQRAKEAAPYIRYCLKSKAHTKKFTYEKIVFSDDLAELRKHGVKKKKPSVDERKISVEIPPVDIRKLSENLEDTNDITEADVEVVDGEEEDEVDSEVTSPIDAEPKKEVPEEESKKNVDPKKGKKEKGKGKEKAEKAEKKKVKEKLAAEMIKPSKFHTKEHEKVKGNSTETEHPHLQKEQEQLNNAPEIVDFQEDLTGEWIYPGSDESDNEASGKRKKSLYAHTWDEAVKILSPLVHSFKITFPSGLIIQVSDSHGPPLTREVKQWYADKGSATPLIESSRYYTSNGSVVKFMMNSTIQIINARGVTTTIREVSANVNREKNNIRRIFTKATAVKVFEGDVILPTGEYWRISKGAKFYHNPLFLFSGGQLPGGETFHRRQDGVIYLHRHDGTVICHYPDGTRFTTRMIIMKDPVEQFEDWVFVGTKTMVEHPNYATVLFNSLSANIHLKLPNGEWVRIFADGGIKVGTVDDYTLDVDRNRALLSYPSCAAGNCGDKKIPNVTSVKLFHSPVPVETAAPIPSPSSKGGLDKKKSDVDQESPGSAPSSVSIDIPVGDVGEQGLEKNTSRLSVDNVGSRNASVKSDIEVSFEKINDRKPTVESLGELNMHEEHDDEAATEHETLTERKKRLIEAQNQSEEIRMDIEEFLQFTDTWTFCKSVDSWDNRFSITVFGDKTVKKSDRFQKEMCVSTENLLNTFAKAKPPTQRLSGILPTTSSENLIKLSKRITAFRQGKIGDCGKMAKTKIFAVKRDLSGYQFLKHQEVDAVLQKVKSNRESVVVVDTLPNTRPRKFITIMEPVSSIEKPNGLWQSVYREPMFRPRVMNNKQLQIAKPEDLRWFGYVLTTAHGKRPKFFADPRTRFLAKKASLLTKSPESYVKSPEYVNNEQMDSTKKDSMPISEAGNHGHSHRHKTHDANSESANQDGEKVIPDGKKVPHVDVLSSEGTEGDKKHKKDLGRKSKDTTKKDKKKKKDVGKHKHSFSKDNKRQSFDGNMDETKDDSKEVEEVEMENKSKKKKDSIYFRKEDNCAEYPEDVLDVEGIYEIAGAEKPKITNKEHDELCTRHKSIVVRNFMEIPQLDETMQNILISASICYGKTVDDQMGIYKTYEIDDPKFEAERKRQKFIKQQLIEQNLEEMHLYEQAQGKVLSFHF